MIEIVLFFPTASTPAAACGVGGFSRPLLPQRANPRRSVRKKATAEAMASGALVAMVRGGAIYPCCLFGVGDFSRPPELSLCFSV